MLFSRVPRFALVTLWRAANVQAICVLNGYLSVLHKLQEGESES